MVDPKILENENQEENGCFCGGEASLGILKDVQRLYEKRLEMIERSGGSQKMQKQIDILRRWVSDLVAQNSLLASTVERLEQEATARTLQRNRHDEWNLDTVRCECDLLREIRMMNDSLQKENATKDREIRRLNMDLQKCQQTCIDLRKEISLNMYTSALNETTKKDAEVMAGMCLTGKECGDWEPVKECSSLSDQIQEYQVKIQDMEGKLKSTSDHVRDLRKANVNLSDELHAVGRVCIVLQESCKTESMRAEFKDDIIKELRRNLKAAKAKLKEYDHQRANQICSIDNGKAFDVDRRSGLSYETSMILPLVRQPRVRNRYRSVLEDFAPAPEKCSPRPQDSVSGDKPSDFRMEATCDDESPRAMIGAGNDELRHQRLEGDESPQPRFGGCDNAYQLGEYLTDGCDLWKQQKKVFGFKPKARGKNVAPAAASTPNSSIECVTGCDCKLEITNTLVTEEESHCDTDCSLTAPIGRQNLTNVNVKQEVDGSSEDSHDHSKHIKKESRRRSTGSKDLNSTYTVSSTAIKKNQRFEDRKQSDSPKERHSYLNRSYDKKDCKTKDQGTVFDISLSKANHDISRKHSPVKPSHSDMSRKSDDIHDNFETPLESNSKQRLHFFRRKQKSRNSSKDGYSDIELCNREVESKIPISLNRRFSNSSSTSRKRSASLERRKSPGSSFGLNYVKNSPICVDKCDGACNLPVSAANRSSFDANSISRNSSPSIERRKISISLPGKNPPERIAKQKVKKELGGKIAKEAVNQRSFHTNVIQINSSPSVERRSLLKISSFGKNSPELTVKQEVKEERDEKTPEDVLYRRISNGSRKLNNSSHERQDNTNSSPGTARSSSNLSIDRYYHSDGSANVKVKSLNFRRISKYELDSEKKLPAKHPNQKGWIQNFPFVKTLKDLIDDENERNIKFEIENEAINIKKETAVNNDKLLAQKPSRTKQSLKQNSNERKVPLNKSVASMSLSKEIKTKEKKFHVNISNSGKQGVIIRENTDRGGGGASSSSGAESGASEAARRAQHYRNKMNASLKSLSNKEEKGRSQSEGVTNVNEGRIASITITGKAEHMQRLLDERTKQVDNLRRLMDNCKCGANKQDKSDAVDTAEVEQQRQMLRTLQSNLSLIEELYRECIYETAKQEEIIEKLRQSCLDVRLMDRKKAEHIEKLEKIVGSQKWSLEQCQDVVVEVESLKSEILNFLNSSNNDSGMWERSDSMSPPPDLAEDLQEIMQLLVQLADMLTGSCICGLAEENSVIKEKNAALEVNITQFCRRVSELESALLQRETMEKQCEERLKSTQEQLQSAQSQLAEWAESNKGQNAECECLKLQLNSTNALLEETNMQLTEAQQQCKAQEDLVRHLKEELINANRIIQENNKVRSEVSFLSQQVKLWRGQLDDSQAAIKTLETQLERVTDRYHQLEVSYREKVNNISVLQSQLHEAQQRGVALCEEASQVVNAVRSWMVRVRRKYSELEEKLRQQDSIISDFQMRLGERQNDTDRTSISENEPFYAKFLKEEMSSHVGENDMTRCLNCSSRIESRSTGVSEMPSITSAPGPSKRFLRKKLHLCTYKQCRCQTNDTQSLRSEPATSPLPIRNDAPEYSVRHLQYTRTATHSEAATSPRPHKDLGVSPKPVQVRTSTVRELSPLGHVQLLQRIEHLQDALEDGQRRWMRSQTQAHTET